MNKDTYDVIIIGGGIAGMTAAIYAARANLRTVVLEREICGGLVNSTYMVENFPSYPAIHGMELMGKVSDHMRLLGVTVEEVTDIVEMKLGGEWKTVATDESAYDARAVILATGRKPVPLTVAEECQQVHYCSICDGIGYKDKRILVVGGGNSGFDEALYLRSLGVGHITLIEMADRFFASPLIQRELLACTNVSARTSTRVKAIVSQDRLKAVVLEDVVTGQIQEVSVDGIFVYMGQHPNTEMLRDCIDLDDSGYIVTGSRMETNISGVFAAGDVVQKIYRQITTAMADGTVAALAVERYLREHFGTSCLNHDDN
ncbi:FAD-dependent oxidoreductase [Desulfoluna sp.]|uniref:NAD(P)/FAD-dependent oxidoreductase n=1 Tax=Desulfoluna sp. TaxID=2045199 RepID=UPI0026170A67|nr:FAD-dependent oxidoreductase [Desulfoluna sp.]